MNSLRIRSGVSSATSSMSMPPSGLTIITGLLGGAIEHDAQIQLALDLQPFLDEHALHDLRPSGPVWCVTSVMPIIVGRGSLGFVGRLGELDAAALAAAAGVNLRLDDDRAAAEPLGDRRAASAALNATSPAARARRARQDGLGLILVNFHAASTLLESRDRRHVRTTRNPSDRCTVRAKLRC